MFPFQCPRSLCATMHNTLPACVVLLPSYWSLLQGWRHCLQNAFGMNLCGLQGCGCHKSNISLQLDYMSSVTKVRMTESSCICMQYADFKVLKACLAVWVFGKVSRPAPGTQFISVSNTTFTTDLFEPHSAVYYVRSLISVHVTK